MWRDPSTAGRLFSCTIVTITANELLAPLHSRMPVILDAEAWDAWLDEEAELPVLRGLLRPAPAGALEVFPVGMGVNSVRNNDPTLLDRLPEPANVSLS